MPDPTGNLFDLGCVVVAGLLTFVAYRTRNRVLVFVATIVGVSVLEGVLLYGFIAYPLLFAVARKRLGRGFGWAFVLSVVAGTLLLSWRIKVPELPSGGPTQRAAAAVTRVRVRDHLWSTPRQPGQYVPRSFEEVEFDLASPGRESIRRLDRIDSGSAAGLRAGAEAAVEYPIGQPSRARLAGATREWSRAALIYMLKLTWGMGCGVMLLLWPIIGVRRSAKGREGKAPFPLRS